MIDIKLECSLGDLNLDLTDNYNWYLTTDKKVKLSNISPETEDS